MGNHVYVFHGGAPAQMAYDAIKRVFHEPSSDLSVLIKVNTGFKGPAASGLCTHPEVVRGLIRFLKDTGIREITVGDSSIVGTNSVEALKCAGIMDVCEQENVKCVNLDDSGIDVREIPSPVMVDKLKLSRLPFEVDRVISAAVMKTHMYAGATLSIKNMKGCLYQRDKTRLHRIFKPLPQNAHAKCLDYGIMDLAKICYADYAIIDGVVAMEGFGPSGGTRVDMGVILASQSPVAADVIALKLMGMDIKYAPHIGLVCKNKGIDPNKIDVFPSDYMKWCKKFLRADQTDLGLHFPNFNVIDRGACSACSAAILQFFRYHHGDFPDKKMINLACGPDLREDDLKANGETVLVGNCTAKFKSQFPFCKGCPPVPSQIARTIAGGKTFDD